MSIISENIKRLRAQKDMTLEELADKVGTTKQTVYKYENDMIKDVPYKKIYAFARALNVTPQQLMGIDDTWAGTPVSEEVRQIPAFRRAGDHQFDDAIREAKAEQKKLSDFRNPDFQNNNNLLEEEERILRAYRKLNPDQKQKLKDYIYDLLTEGD